MSDSDDHSSKIAVKQNSDGSIQAQAEVRGILLHTRDLEKWKAMVPDAPERILAMTEKEQHHRHRSQSNGQLTAIVIVLAVLALCGYMASIGQAIGGVATVLGGLGILVGTAAYNNRSKPQ